MIAPDNNSPQKPLTYWQQVELKRQCDELMVIIFGKGGFFK